MHIVQVQNKLTERNTKLCQSRYHLAMNATQINQANKQTATSVAEADATRTPLTALTALTAR